MDLAVSNEFGSSVSVLLNQTVPGSSTASFQAQQTFATTAGDSLAAVDFNGDGKPDFAVSAKSGTQVSVLTNTTATGSTTVSFTSEQLLTTGYNSRFISAADFNGDGRTDLVTSNYGNLSLSVLLNTTPPIAITPSASGSNVVSGTGSSQPYDVTLADVNGDGKPDLIVANSGNNDVSVLINTTAPGAGTPSFAAQATFATGLNPRDVAVGDFNGDGLPDIAVTNENSSTVSVLLNTTARGSTVASFMAHKRSPPVKDRSALPLAT